MTVFPWCEVVLYAVLPLSPLFMWELFGFAKIPFSVSCVFKINPGILNGISNNISLKVIKIGNFTPQCQIYHPPIQCLKALYLPVSIRYPTADCRHLGFYLAPLLNLCKFPIKKGLLDIISIVHQNLNLGTGESKNTLNCPCKYIDWNLYKHWDLWCLCGRIFNHSCWICSCCWHNL